MRAAFTARLKSGPSVDHERLWRFEDMRKQLILTSEWRGGDGS